MILLIILFFALQVLILFCCLAAGNDPYSQQLSDQAQKGSCPKEHAAFLAARVLVI